MRTTSAVLLASLLALGCGDDGSGPDEAELTGSWNATSIEYVSTANSATRVDLVAMGGSGTLTLSSDKTFTMHGSAPGEGTTDLAGTWSASVDVLTMTMTGGGFTNRWQFEMTLSGGRLTLRGADSEFDFDGDDQDDPAKLNLVLQRG